MGILKPSVALKPSTSLLCKLGSLIVHADEALSNGGHQFDIDAFKTLLIDKSVEFWLSEMTELALIPVKRKK